MAYYNHAMEQDSCELAQSQYPGAPMAVQQQVAVGQPQIGQHQMLVGQQQMVVGHPGQQQMVGQPHYPMQIAIGTYANGYSRITSVCLGVLQIGLSWISIAAAVMALIFNASGADIGTGFWCAAIYLTAGSIHIAAGVKPTNELITAATVFATLVFPFGATQLSLAVYGLVDSIICGDQVCVSTNACTIAANAAMGNIGALEMVFGLCLFIVGLRAMCCPPKSQQQMILIANSGTTAMVPTVGIAPNGLMAVASTSSTQNHYTAEDHRHDAMQDHHHLAEASAPDYSLYNGKHNGLD